MPVPRLMSLACAATSAMLLLAPVPLRAEPVTRARLLGTWDYRSFAGMLHGHPTGKLEMAPGTMVFSYSEDGKWMLQTAEHDKRAGTFLLRSSELIMKDADGSVYQDFKVDVTPDGKQMTLTDSDSLIVAVKLQGADK